jgi:hypothetical protein
MLGYDARFGPLVSDRRLKETSEKCNVNIGKREKGRASRRPCQVAAFVSNMAARSPHLNAVWLLNGPNVAGNK